MRPIGRFLRIGAAVAVGWAAARAVPAQNADQIVTKMNAAYANAKTYQAVYQTELSMKSKGSMSLTIELKTVPEKKLYFHIAPSGPGTGEMGRRSAGLRMLVVDDGQTGLAYFEALKRYTKGPHAASFDAITASYGILLGHMKPKPGSVHLLRSQTLSGRPVYVLQMGKPSASAESERFSMRIYVDQQTYLVRRTETNGQNKGDPVSAVTAVTSDRVGAPLPDSAFQFRPPSDATEMSPSSR